MLNNDQHHNYSHENIASSLLPMSVSVTAEAQTAEALPDDLEIQSEAGGSKYIIRSNGLNKGIYFLHTTKNGEVEIFLCSLLFVIALFRDVKNTGWGRLLQFKDTDGHDHEYVLNAANVSKDESVLISALRHEGLTITTQKQHHFRLIDYLLNTKPLTSRKIRSTSKTGWYTNSLFVTQLECFGETDEEVVYDGKTTHHSFAVSGTLTQWQQNIGRWCIGNPILTFSTSTTFAAPLLKPLGCENGGFNMMGDSSIGKSSSLKVATTTFGRPEKGHAIQQWNATVNAMEAIANSYNDIMLPLDEIGQATGSEIGNTIYMLGNGMGKGRMSSNAELKNRQTFRTLFLSSGEKTLEAHMGEAGKSVRAGQEVRLVDIVADMGMNYGIYCNIHGFKNSHDFNEFLLGNVLQFYGSPMAAYLQQLVDLPEYAIERMHKYIADFISETVPEGADGQVKRIAGRFALVACGGELATKMGITGWEPGTVDRDARILFERWLNDRGNIGQSEDQKLSAQVRRFFELHGESRFALMGKLSDTRLITNRVGFREVGTIEVRNPVTGKMKLENQTVYYVMAEGFKEICSGFNCKRASRKLLDQGMLKANGDGTAMHSKRLPGFASPKKVYVFTDSIIENYEKNTVSGVHVPSEGTADTQAQAA